MLVFPCGEHVGRATHRELTSGSISKPDVAWPTCYTVGMSSCADTADEFFHPVGDDRSWSESYYFNFTDPTSQIGAFTRMGFRPREGWADALHGVYLPGGRVAFTYGRRTDITPEVIDAMGAADPQVANLTLTRGEPFTTWGIAYRGEAQVMDDPSVMLVATKDRPEPWHTPVTLDMDVTFTALAEPHYARGGSQGHFEQTGKVTGRITLGDEQWEVDGFGVRDKSWGPRTWQAPSGSASKSTEPAAVTEGCFINWFSMNFGPDVALGGTCGRVADGSMRGKGWIQRDGEVLELTEVAMTTVFDDTEPLLHRSVQLTATDSRGNQMVIDGEVLTICPTKVPRRDGVTFINEGHARFTMDGRVGYGIAEHWHAVVR